MTTAKETKTIAGNIQIKSLTRSALEKLVRDTVQETLKGLGFDTARPAELQADMYYLRKLRRSGEEARNWIKRSVLTVVLSATLYLLWEALAEKIRKG